MENISRRSFLTAATVAGCGAGLLPATTSTNAAQYVVDGTGMKLGMVTYQMGAKMGCDELITLCQQAGLAGVELRTTHAHGVESSLSKPERDAVRKKFADSGVAIAGLGTAFEFHSQDAGVVRKNIEGAKEYVKLAADVGAPGVKVRPNGVNKGEELAVTHERIGKAWGELAAFAADFGVQIWMEVHGPEGSREPASIRAMLDHARHPNALVCWNCNGGETDADGSIKANFDLLKHAIAEVHINDIGISKYPWQELFTLLKGINYQGYCLAEIEYNDQPVRFMQYYRMLFDLYTGRYRYPAV